MKMRAPRSGWPTREIELLIADPTPEYRPEIEPIKVLVSGATTKEIPRPNRSAYGRMSVIVSSGGMRLAGSLIDAFHGAESAGIREYHRRPVAIRSGPATRKRREPSRPARVPILVDSTASMMPVGRPVMPAPRAV